MDDNKIIALYEQRDEIALKETADKYGGYCFTIANNILSNEQDCEECVNDTYLRIWNSIPPQKPKSLKMFAAKIVRNLALDRYRAKNRQKRGADNVCVALDEVVELVADTVDIDTESAERTFAELLGGFLRALPERECNVFIRRYFYFESVSEIAKKYALRDSHIRVILSVTRKKLREFLRKEGYIIK